MRILVFINRTFTITIAERLIIHNYYNITPSLAVGNSYISTSVFVKVLVPGGVVLLLITFVIIIIAVVFLIPKCCKRNKKIDNHELEVS